MAGLTFTMKPRLETPRLFLEPANAWHGESLFPALGDPMLYLYSAEPPPLGAGALMRRLEALEADAAAIGWALRLKESGYIGLASARAAGETARLTLAIGAAWRRRGLGAEALGAVLGFLGDAGAEAALAVVDTRDALARRFLENQGFSLSDTAVMVRNQAGVWADEHSFRRILEREITR